MSGEARGRNPYGGDTDTVRQRIERRMRLARESRHVGMEDRRNRPVTLHAVSDTCPAHPSEPLYECAVCADEVDR